MKNITTFCFALMFLVAPPAQAQTVYTDSYMFTEEESAAIELLTEAEIFTGNPDGSFRSRTSLNRAEFMMIAMRLYGDGPIDTSSPCFPDVPLNTWYAQSVCRAKALGIVRGNAEAGVLESKWRFEPARAVQYEEAVKVLVHLYAVPIVETEQNSAAEVDMAWYVPYIEAAEQLEIGVEGLVPGDIITRGEMARLTANFYAYGMGLQSSSSANSSVSTSQSMQSSTATTQSSTSSYTYDSHGSVELADGILLLGEVTPVLTSVKIFSDAQPMNLTDISFTLASAANSVESILVYDQEGRYLGRATLRSGSTYTLSVRTTDIEIPRREDFSIYARAQLKPEASGGVSGETVEVSQVLVEGTGAWNNKDMSESSSDDFPNFQTARSRITSIANAGPTEDVLVEGTGLLVGKYQFTGETGDGQADLAVTDLAFQIESAGGVSISNVQLSADGTSETMSCSIASSTVNCSNISATFGSLEDRPRTIQLYADVSVPATSDNQFLRLSLNQPGNIGSAGSVTWTDGDTSFVWVPFGNPVVRGTHFK